MPSVDVDKAIKHKTADSSTYRGKENITHQIERQDSVFRNTREKTKQNDTCMHNAEGIQCGCILNLQDSNGPEEEVYDR